MEKFTLTDDEKSRGLSLPQRVLTWWYNLGAKEKLALEIKYDIKPIMKDDQVWEVYQFEHQAVCPHCKKEPKYREVTTVAGALHWAYECDCYHQIMSTASGAKEKYWLWHPINGKPEKPQISAPPSLECAQPEVPMDTTIITLGNINGSNSDGLPDREVVRQAQKNLSMNAKFWILIKNFRIPYKIINGKLVEASYTEAVKGLKTPPVMDIYWLKDEEYEFAKVSAENMTWALKVAQEEKIKLDLFKQD